ncbi:hypothetical protein HDU76_002771 [Blyttiomyces sp. JEL0837]|nr:hypothetical protein HDU76_002771 [Blyttiomyces sp. JEL0837]
MQSISPPKSPHDSHSQISPHGQQQYPEQYLRGYTLHEATFTSIPPFIKESLAACFNEYNAIQRSLLPMAESGIKYMQQTELITRLTNDRNQIVGETDAQLRRIPQDEARLRALRDSYAAGQAVINNCQAQLARAQKELEVIDIPHLSAMNDLRKRLAVVVTRIFELDTRYPFERKLAKKIQNDITKLQMIAQHRYNHISHDSEIQSNIRQFHDSDSHLAFSSHATQYHDFTRDIAINMAVAETALYFKDLNATSMAGVRGDLGQKLSSKLDQAKSINKQDLTTTFNKLIKDISSLHKLRLKILDSTPGLIHSYSPLSPSHSPFQQALPNTDTISNFYFPMDIHKLQNLFGFHLSPKEFFELQVKPVTNGQIAECLGVFLEDVEVDVVLSCLDLGEGGGSGSGGDNGLNFRGLRLNEGFAGGESGSLPAYSESS